jgi:argininosuccinate lyase
VEEVNKLVNAGTPFRDAYKKVGLDIEEGKFRYDISIQHTHEGSIGNLCTAAIQQQMDNALSAFPFETVNTAIARLLQP